MALLFDVYSRLGRHVRRQDKTLDDYLRFLEHYVNMASIQIKRAHEDLMIAPETSTECNMMLSKFFLDAHFHTICVHKSIGLVKKIAKRLDDSIIKDLMVTYKDQIECYTLARNHLEHLDHRITASGSFSQAMGFSVGMQIEFSDATISMLPSAIYWLYSMYDTVISRIVEIYDVDPDSGSPTPKVERLRIL